MINVHVDVTDRDKLADGVRRVLDRFRAIDVVCANAGIGGGGAAVADPAFGAWERDGRQPRGVVNTVKAVVPGMRERGEGGHVVITSSVAGITALPYEHGAYTTSKFAVRGLGESLRLSLAEEGIGVSILCPGLTDTGILGGSSDDTVEFQRIDGAMDPLEVVPVVGDATTPRTSSRTPSSPPQVPRPVRRARRRRTTDQAVPPDRAAFEQHRRMLCDRLRDLPALG